MDISTEQDSKSADTPVISAMISTERESLVAGAIPSGELENSELNPLERLTEELAGASENYASAMALQALNEGDAGKALTVCDSVEMQSDDRSVPLSLPLIRGRALLALERPAEAAEDFHRVLRQEPECPAALKGLGDTHFVQHKEAIAFTYYERARELSGNFQSLSESVRYSNIAEDTTENIDIDIETEGLSDSGLPANSGAQSMRETVKVALEEIVVRDFESEPEEKKTITPQVSLTMKRSQESAPAAVTPEKVIEPPKKDIVKAPIVLAEQYDRPKRPAHYQTETMADLLLQQGHIDAAIDIYRVLVQKDSLTRLTEKLAKAESRQRRSR